MSGSENSGGDWGQASEALFRASRTDHDATPGDRVRVAEALARRLEAAGTLSTGGVAGASELPTRAGSLLTVGNGIKSALVVVLTVGSVALMRQVDRSGERAQPKPREASPSAVHAARSEIQSVGSVPEEVSTRPPRERVEPQRAVGVEGAEGPRHALRSSRASEGGKSRAPATVQPRGTATLRSNAPGETT